MAVPNHEDWVLMQAIANGDESAIDRLYERFGTFVFRCVRQSLADHAEAEDEGTSATAGYFSSGPACSATAGAADA